MVQLVGIDHISYDGQPFDRIGNLYLRKQRSFRPDTTRLITDVEPKNPVLRLRQARTESINPSGSNPSASVSLKLEKGDRHVPLPP